MDLSADLVEAASAFLWDLNTTGIAEVERDDVADAAGLIAGFETKEDAQTAAVALERGQGEIKVERLSIEPIDPGDWIDEEERARLEIGGMSTDFAVGGAFGDGGHPSTSLALALLAMSVRPSMAVLDFGTGTGILTLAAHSFGAQRLVAVDNDPNALTVARTNLRAIEPPAVVDLAESLAAVTRSTGSHAGEGASEDAGESKDLSVLAFDVIVANVLLPVHVAEADALLRLLAPGGALVVSGVLVSQGEQALACYPGMKVEQRQEYQDWLAMVLRSSDA